MIGETSSQVGYAAEASAAMGGSSMIGVCMVKLEEQRGALRQTLEDVGYVFVDESGEVSKRPVAWSFDQYVKQVEAAGEDSELACILDATQDYIKSAERLKLAAARLVGSGAVEGATAGAGEMVEALDACISVPVELAMDLARQGLAWVPVKEGVASKRQVMGPLVRRKDRRVVTVERTEGGELLFKAPAELGPVTFLDLVDGLDKEGLPYSLEAIREGGFTRGRGWALTVDGSDSKVILDLDEEGHWRAKGTVTV